MEFVTGNFCQLSGRRIPEILDGGAVSGEKGKRVRDLGFLGFKEGEWERKKKLMGLGGLKKQLGIFEEDADVIYDGSWASDLFVKFTIKVNQVILKPISKYHHFF